MRASTLVLVFALAAAVGCGAPTTDPDQDAGARSDAGQLPQDGGDVTDGGEAPSDAGESDAGDGGDAGDADAGDIDGGVDGGLDGGPGDAGVDAGSPPDTVIVSAPSGVIATTTVQVEFTSDDVTATFECSLDLAPFTTCASPAAWSSLSEGAHSVQVVAIDVTGERDPSPAQASWTVDTQAPDTRLLGGPTPTAPGTSATFTFEATEANSTFECALDGSGFTPCTSPFVFTGTLANGVHSFEVRATDALGHTDSTPAAWSWTFPAERVRVMAANTTSGNFQSYDPGHGIRIFQGLKPDIALIQEFNYGTNSAADLRTFVDLAFGPDYHYAVESGVQIPNGVVSRYPIRSSGFWNDPQVSNREFVWAQIDVPGAKDLWVVSVHLLTSSASVRNQEAQALVAAINAAVPAGDFLIIGGDFNTDTRTEACITTLSQVVVTSPSSAPYPADQNGVSATNAARTKPYDWVLADPDLNPLETPVTIGTTTFPAGLVFDSRVFTPLSEVAPVQLNDSGAPNMQHMAVVKDYVIAH